MKVEHIGYAVKNIEKSMSVFQKMGYVFGEVIDDTDRNIKIAFGVMDGYKIELVAPLEKDKPSPVDAYVQKSGNTPYHICYESEDFEADVKQLEEQRFKIVIPPAPACAFGGRRVVFMNQLSMGLLEIVEAEHE